MLQKSKDCGQAGVKDYDQSNYRLEFERRKDGKGFSFTIHFPNGNKYASRKPLCREDLPDLEKFFSSNGANLATIDKFRREAMQAIEEQRPKAPCATRRKNGHPYYNR